MTDEATDSGVQIAKWRQGWRTEQEYVKNKAALLVWTGGKCETCPWQPPDESLLHAHHVLPRHLGGEDWIDNLILLCPNCHAVAHWLLRMGRRFPQVGGKVRLRREIREARTAARLAAKAKHESRAS